MPFLFATECLRESDVALGSYPTIEWLRVDPDGPFANRGPRSHLACERRFRRQCVTLLDEAVRARAQANDQNGGRIIHLPESLSL
jgi:hypothetical protein